MNQWGNIFRGILLIIGIGAMIFMAELYIVCKQLRNEIDTISDQQKVDAQVNSNKFKYQQDQIEGLIRDLDDAQQQIKGQNDAMLQEIEKRQQVENENKGIQTTLVDIVAEADAIKQDMKGWQRDYATVLAQIEKRWMIPRMRSKASKTASMH